MKDFNKFAANLSFIHFKWLNEMPTDEQVFMDRESLIDQAQREVGPDGVYGKDFKFFTCNNEHILGF